METDCGRTPVNHRYVPDGDVHENADGDSDEGEEGDPSEYVGNLPELSPSEDELLAPFAEPLLTRCGLCNMDDLALGDEMEDHIMAASSRAYACLEDRSGGELPADRPYTIATSDLGDSHARACVSASHTCVARLDYCHDLHWRAREELPIHTCTM